MIYILLSFLVLYLIIKLTELVKLFSYSLSCFRFQFKLLHELESVGKGLYFLYKNVDG